MRRLDPAAIEQALADLPGWTCVEDHHLARRYAFDDFAAALDFVNRVGAEAEARDHHPDLRFGWGYCEVELHTHSAGGLTGKDLELAAAIDRLAHA